MHTSVLFFAFIKANLKGHLRNSTMQTFMHILLCYLKIIFSTGWRKFWSRRENRPYFFNRVTGDTMWEMPPFANHHQQHPHPPPEFHRTSDPLGINDNGPTGNGPQSHPHHHHHPPPPHHQPHHHQQHTPGHVSLL